MKKECFAFSSIHRCNALSTLDCENCRFYKTKNKIIDNVFYPWSYKDKNKYLKDKKELEAQKKCMK